MIAGEASASSCTAQKARMQHHYLQTKHTCPASYGHAAGSHSAAAVKGPLFGKDATSREWLSESRLRYKQPVNIDRAVPIRLADSQVAAGMHCDYMTTNRNAFKLPAAGDYPKRCTAPVEDTSLTEAGGKTNYFESTYSALTIACQKNFRVAPCTSAGRMVSKVSPYNIIHGGDPLPNNYRFETFAGQPTHRKRPQVVEDDPRDV